MFNPLFRQSFRKFTTASLRSSFVRFNSSASSAARTATRVQSLRNQPTAKLLFGTTFSILTFNAFTSLNGSRIYNDTASRYANQVESGITSNVKQIKAESKLGSTLNYNELTIGSITGLFLGIIAGKLSSAIVFLALSGYFLTQFLESRGIISIPWSQVIHIGSEKIDVKQLVLEQPSFKIPFVLTFLIAAYNI